MRLLLDTHGLLWALAAPKKIPKQTRGQIEAAHHEVLFSASSVGGGDRGADRGPRANQVVQRHARVCVASKRQTACQDLPAGFGDAAFADRHEAWLQDGLAAMPPRRPLADALRDDRPVIRRSQIFSERGCR
jgi:hypothetical protein